MKGILGKTLQSTIFVYLFYALAHAVTNITPTINEYFVLSLFFISNLFLHFVTDKYSDKFKKKINYVVTFGTLGFGLQFFIVMLDFMKISLFLGFLVSIITGMIFGILHFNLNPNNKLKA